jgi:hypothetical protein
MLSKFRAPRSGRVLPTPRDSAAGETNDRAPQTCIEVMHVRTNQKSDASFVSTPKLTH